MPDNDYNDKYHQEFFQFLKDEGLFVRDYDARGRQQLALAMGHLLKVVVAMDNNNRKGWKQAKVGVLLRHWCKATEQNFGL
jgi:hypothetical protein